MEYQRVYITTDNDGHNYILPYALKDQFEDLLEAAQDSTDDEEAFIALFSHYMTGVGINSQPLYIKTTDKQ